MNNDLLIELGCEDLPARYVLPLADALAKGSCDGLAKRGITVHDARVFATPRRIAVLISDVAANQPDQTVERSGPALTAALKDGQPTPAALGFARSCGVEFAALGRKEGKLYFQKTSPGRKTAELIPEIFEEALRQMDELVPKRMRWGSGDETFVRPVQWLVAMHGAKVIPIMRFGLKSTNKTYGHRFHAPKALVLKSPAEYEKKLKAARVWADFAGRREEIWKQIQAEAKALKGTPHDNAALLDEVTALVEWPVAISGHIEKRFLELPPEVIVATIETNQRYFPVFARNGKLLPSFITVSNIKSKNVRHVIAGNERVVRPRLSDAMFFWEQDLRQPLESYGDKLSTVTFQKELGSVADRVKRIEALAGRVAVMLREDALAVERAALLCKNDLVTRMVYEFPELQGLMGGHYAGKSGESPAVVMAVREHYLPTQQGTPIPSTREGQIVALADKLDLLAGIFAIGQKPTASKDPFALRRAALGVLRICIEGKLALDVNELLKLALELQPKGKRDEATLRDLNEFVMERLRAYYEKLPVEMFEAVKALDVTSPLDFDARVKAVHGFWTLPPAKNLSAAHKRIRNILKQSGSVDGPMSEQLLSSGAERNLYLAMTEQMNHVESFAKVADYQSSLQSLAKLQVPVDRFFTEVMVNVDDVKTRNNRLTLLTHLDRLCRSVADISCLPG